MSGMNICHLSSELQVLKEIFFYLLCTLRHKYYVSAVSR